MHEIFVSINSLDRSILSAIQSYLQNDFFDWLMPIVTALGNGGIGWIVLALILICTKKYRKAGLVALLAIIINTLLGEVILKNIIQRARPFINDTSLKILITKPISYSFPSGHTGASVAAAAALSANIKGYGKYFWILAGLIAFSRLYLYVHYPTDVIAGIILGLISYKLAEILYNRIISRKIPNDKLQE